MMPMSDQEIEALIQQAKTSNQAMELASARLKAVAASQDATTHALQRITILLREMNRVIDSQDERIAGNAQEIALIKKHIGLDQ